MAIYTVIMAGGQGTRFWPQSRQALPKQFLTLLGKESLLQATYRRLAPLAPAERCLVLTDQRYGPLVRQQLPDLPAANLILEPANRDTAPCIGLVAAKLYQKDPDAVLAILPADHHIVDAPSFVQCAQTALTLAEETSHIVTIGIMPTYAAEGYGYLQAGEALDLPYSQAIFAVSRFVEKPSAAKAEAYLEQGGYYWNSGMFFARAAVLLAAIEHCMPELSFGLQKLLPSLNTPEELQALAEYYPALEKCSFDYGVMEHTTQILTVVGDFAWDDVGTWQAVARYWPQEVGQNHWCGSLLPVIIDSRDCFIHCDGRLVAALGVRDLLIVCCDDVILVADKNRSQEVKQVVEEVRRRGLDLYL